MRAVRASGIRTISWRRRNGSDGMKDFSMRRLRERAKSGNLSTAIGPHRRADGWRAVGAAAAGRADRQPACPHGSAAESEQCLAARGVNLLRRPAHQLHRGPGVKNGTSRSTRTARCAISICVAAGTILRITIWRWCRWHIYRIVPGEHCAAAGEPDLAAGSVEDFGRALVLNLVFCGT